MAISDPLIFDAVDIGGNQYELRDVDGTNIGNEIEKLIVDAGLEIPSKYISTLEFPVYDLAISTDLILNTDVDPATDKQTVQLVGASGSSTVEIQNVYPVGKLDFSNNLPAYMVSVRAAGATAPINLI